MGEPLSRVEAILQNILGADNILVPPGSQVEEILQAIYYNTEYEKNPKSRVAEILLAIKNKGVYDGPVLSRVEDILVHKLNGIPYTKHKKEDLSRVEQLLLDWLEQGGGEEIIEYTGTFPMTILANGEPLLDYIISGNTVQSGTPTPDSPVMPEGTGERTGNLFDGDFTVAVMSVSGNTATLNTASSGRTAIVECEPNTTYTVKKHSVSNRFIIAESDIKPVNGTAMSIIQNNSSISEYTFTTSNTTQYVAVYCSTSSEQSEPQLMLNLGSTALPYEPYGYKIPISSANTTTPVYLGEVQTTRKIKKLVLTGEENWNTYQSTYYITVSDYYRMYDIGSHLSVCSHYPNIQVMTLPEMHYCLGGLVDGSTHTAWNGNIVFNPSPMISSLTDWNAFLAQQYAAGTPVTVWYVLATEETGIVNEPLMKIGDYADTLSMEQAGKDIPTNKKPTETVVDVPTSVKPSEGYIKYTEPTDGPTPKTQVLGTKNHEIYMTSNNEVYILRR